MIIDVFTDAFKYTTKDIKPLLKLGVMSFLSFLIIPLFLLEGYSFRVIKIGAEGMINGQDPLPSFKDLLSMFIDGITVVLIRVVYLIIPVLLLLVIYYLSSIQMYLPALILAVIGLILNLVLLLFYYLAIPNFAVTGKISEAFNFKVLYEKMKSISIPNYIGFYIVLFIIELAIQLTATYILKLIFEIFGIIISFTGGMELYSIVAAILINAILILIILPFCSLIKSRCIGSIYSLSD